MSFTTLRQLLRGMVTTADHGPCVSGAHNTIVAARAGKDLVSSLISGLATIGRLAPSERGMCGKQESQ